MRTNLSEQQLRWREQRVYFNQDIALDFLSNGLLYSVLVLALALVIPGLNRNAQVRAVLAPINQQWEQTTERVNRLYQGLNRQASPADLDLRQYADAERLPQCHQRVRLPRADAHRPLLARCRLRHIHR